MRVLIIDDEPHIRATTAAALAGLGHTTAGAVNGAQVLQLLEETNFEIAFLDLRLDHDPVIGRKRHGQNRPGSVHS